MVLNLILAGLVAVLVVTGIVSKATDKFSPYSPSNW